MGGNRKQCPYCAVSLYGMTMSTDVLLTFLSGVLVSLKRCMNDNLEFYVNTFFMKLKAKNSVPIVILKKESNRRQKIVNRTKPQAYTMHSISFKTFTTFCP